MRKSYVYKITCKINDEFYFGSSFNAKSDKYWGSGRRIKERIAQYGKENFVKEILEEFDDRTISHQVENQYIEKFRNDEKCLNERLDHHFDAYSDETCAKISAANSGEKNHNFRKNFSDETRAKLSAANRGKHHTEETRAKMSASRRGEKNPMYGKHLSDETRAKISAAKLGKILSEEHRAKISAAHCGKHWCKNPVTGKREYYD